MRTAMLILIGFLAALLVFAGITLLNNDSTGNEGATLSVEERTVLRGMLQTPQIQFNNVTLTDSTLVNLTTNTCKASRLGMVIEVNPCVAQDLDGRDIKQKVNFTWNGGASQNTSWIFVYDGGALQSGKIEVMMNRTERAYEVRQVFVNNFLVDKIVNSTNLGTPNSSCQLGSTNNTQMYSVNRLLNAGNSTATNTIYCFTTLNPINATAVRISGNVERSFEVDVPVRRLVDVTDQVQFLGLGLLNDSRAYYRVSNVVFSPGETIDSLWTYTPLNRTRNGKWHILGFNANNGLVNSIINNQYVYMDPWWDASWTKKRNITLENRMAVNLFNFTSNFTVQYSASMQTDYDDIRFVDSTETIEYPYWIDTSNASEARIYVRVADINITATANTTIWMYYGNPAATARSNKNNTFLFAEDFGGNSLNVAKWNSSVGGSPAAAIQIGGGQLSITRPVGAGNQINGIIMGRYQPVYPYMVSYKLRVIQCDFSNSIWLGGGTSTDVLAYTYADMDNNVGGHEFGCFGASWSPTGAAENRVRIIGDIVDGPGTTGELARQYNISFIDFAPLNKSVVINGTYQATNANKNANFSRPVVIVIGGGANAASNFSIDDYRIQTWANTPPRPYIGSEINLAGVTTTLSSPQTGLSTNNPNITFIVNSTSLGATGLSNVSLYVWNSTGAQVKSNFSTLSGNGSSTTFTHTISDGNYVWNAITYGNDTPTSEAWGVNRTFTIDSSFPIIAINTPQPGQFFITPTFPYNVALSANSSDATLQACWYSTNGIANTTYTCNISSQNVSFTSFGNKTIYASANDSFGLVATANVSFGIATYSQRGSATSVEGAVETFYLDVNMTDIPSTSGFFKYNNTNYDPSTQTSTQNSTSFTYVLTIPNGFGSAAGIAQKWNWTFNISNLLQNYQTTQQTQTVLAVEFDNCTFTTVAYNLTLRDEDTQAILSSNNNTNLSIQVDLNFSSSTGISVSNFSANFTNINPVRICTNLNIANITYYVDGVIRYSSTGRAVEFYHLQNASISNLTIPQHIQLYDLDSARAVSFLITAKDDTLSPFQGALLDITRKYISEGIFKTVEVPKTDDSGQAVAHLVLEDEIYTILVKKNGELLAIFDTVTVVCTDPSLQCTLNLNTLSSTTEPTNFETTDGVIYRFSPLNRSSRLITTTFSLQDSGTATMLLNVTKSDAYGNNSVCSQSLTSSSGTLTCTISPSEGNVTFIAQLFKNGQFVGENYYTFIPSAGDVFGYTGVILTLLLFGILPLMFIGSLVVMLIASIAGLIIAGALNLYTGGSLLGVTSTIIWFVLVGAIYVWKLSEHQGS